MYRTAWSGTSRARIRGLVAAAALFLSEGACFVAPPPTEHAQAEMDVETGNTRVRDLRA